MPRGTDETTSKLRPAPALAFLRDGADGALELVTQLGAEIHIAPISEAEAELIAARATAWLVTQGQRRRSEGHGVERSRTPRSEGRS